MNTNTFEYLVSLDELGTLSAVAEKYYISPSAISQSLRKEEQNLGVPLFRQKNHRMVPTDAGKIYLQGAREIIQTKTETYNALKSTLTSGNEVNICCASSLYPVMSQTGLPALCNAFPDLDFRLKIQDSRTGLEYLRNGLADFSLLCVQSLNNSTLVEHCLGSDSLVLVVPRSFLPEHTQAGDIAVLFALLQNIRQLPLILLRPNSYMRPLQNEILAKCRLISDRSYEVDDFMMAYAFLQEGRGITLLPESVLPENAKAQYFIIPLGKDARFKKILAYPHDLRLSQRAETISDIIVKSFIGGLG